MVATQDSSSPLAVIIGITGQQGGSVAKALIESSQPYRIVGLTRDVSKPSAQAWISQGVELRQVDLQPENKKVVTDAFEGADVLFAVTNTMELLTVEKEVLQGKLLIDAAKEAGVKLFIWSNLYPAKKLSGGRLELQSFDAKAEITEYLKSSHIEYRLVPAGLYLRDLLFGPWAPREQPDGSFVLLYPEPAKKKVLFPVIDIPNDYGRYVRAAVENPNLSSGAEVLTGTMISFDDQVFELTRITGKTYHIKYASEDEWNTLMAPINDMVPFNPPMSQVLYNAMDFVVEFGYYGAGDLEASQKAAGIVSPSFHEIIDRYKTALV